jgi:hypothetical protein
MFNHSKYPNVNWYLKDEKDEIVFMSWCAIQAGESLCISYGAWGRQYEEADEGEGGEDEEGKEEGNGEGTFLDVIGEACDN